MKAMTVMAGLAAALAAAAPATAIAADTNGRIVFQSNRAATALPELFTMAADGTDVVRLTWNVAGDRMPSFSPDGQQIVFASDRAGTGFDIYVMNADGTDVRRLTSDPARDDNPVFTADGRHIVFQRGPFFCPCALWIVGVDASGERELATGSGNAMQPDTAPHGEKLAFASDRGGAWDIYVTDLRGGPVKRITEGPAAFGDFRPRWSPKGNDVVFLREDGLNLNDIWVVHASGNGLRQLTSGSRFEEQVRWSPDGKRILFTVFDPGSSMARLHTIDAEDGSDDRVLPQLAAPLVEGFDDGRIDSALWHQVVSGAGVSIAEAAGRLVVDFAAGAVPGAPFNQIATHIGLQCQLAGDFDMQVDYALLDWPSANGLQAFLSGFTTFTSAQIFRESKPWGERYGSWIDPSFNASDTSDVAGRLRLVRSGGTVTASYLAGGAWVSLNTAWRPEAMVAGVGAGDFQTFSGLHVSVAFDDFRITSGELTCPSWWRDAAPDWAATG